MKAFAVAVTALFAGIVSAQFQQLPGCAQNCTTNAIPSSCNLSPKCICSDAGFINAITCCVSMACGVADQESTIKYADSICVAAGVTNLPTAATCAKGTASSTTSLNSAASASAGGTSEGSRYVVQGLMGLGAAAAAVAAFV